MDGWTNGWTEGPEGGMEEWVVQSAGSYPI